MEEETKMEKKIMVVVGARPNFMKAAPILAAIREFNAKASGRESEPQDLSIRPILVHTGQHYDAAMSDQFFADLDLPHPDIHLGVGSGSHAVQTAEVMKRFEEVLLKEKPDAVIVVGDVNSTLACSLATAKISFDKNGTRPLIAHVEAGLRSFDRAMPEEVNRVATDHLSDLLFVTEQSGLENLRREGISMDKVFFVGNTMIDSLLAFQHRADQSEILEKLGLRERTGSEPSVTPYALLTLHRPSNVDSKEAFREILEGISEISARSTIIFPVHPRTRQRISEFGLEDHFGNGHSGNVPGIRLVEPLGYLDFMCVMKHAILVVTDSGGIQEETTCLGVPCVTVRENTERPVTVEKGTNVLAGTQRTGIQNAIRSQLSGKIRGEVPEKWDGEAAQRILGILLTELGEEAKFREARVGAGEQVLAK
jgi:UDP-N-acetylglucosamine 2-epimerase (non-hydrolysing)